MSEINFPLIANCPGTLASGFSSYSNACLKEMFNGKTVSHMLQYQEFSLGERQYSKFHDTQKRVSVSGVQEKFSLLLDKKQIRLINDAETGTYILKTVPEKIKNASFMPANEHLTMQIARQVFDIETAANCMIFFAKGAPALLVKRFDFSSNFKKLAMEDMASILGKTPQTHGSDYKYNGNYLEIFEALKKIIPAYKIESIKLYKLLLFNYLFSNGDAHLKNFSILETALGDFRLSPAYDLLNSRIHIDDFDFAMEEGLLPKNIAKGKVKNLFLKLADLVGISNKKATEILLFMCSNSEKVEKLIGNSFLSDKLKRNYLQAYQSRLKKLMKE